MGTHLSRLRILAAAGVHAFTALGGAFGLLALIAAADGMWERAFAWLGAALIVDGADGPLARRAGVKAALPRFSGDDLDHIVDYVTYVAVPAFIVARAELVPQDFRLPCAIAIMIVSCFHFADRESKTDDGYFVGFPAIWNLIALYCFVLAIPPYAALALIVLCAVFTFVPLHYLHPMRVRRMRPITFAMTALWAVAAAAAIAHGFPGAAWEKAIFLATAAYFLTLGLTARGKA